jgi:CubicO group peptidase (beta-lactamase class C family)
MVILHKGKIVFEKKTQMFDFNKHHSYSVTKSYISTALALLETDGLIDVNNTVDFYLTELKGTDWGAVPIIDVLGMSAVMGNDLENYAEIFFN